MTPTRGNQVTVFMLAPGVGDPTLASRAWASVPKAWARLMVIQDGPDAAYRQLIDREKIRVVTHPFRNFAESKNVGLEHTKTDWVFVLDADEWLSPELIAEIEATLEHPQFDAYEVPRANRAFGRVVRHGGWYPDWQLKLLRPSFGRYVGEVHELIKQSGPVGRLVNDLDHDNIRSLAQYHAKIDHYTNYEADILKKAGRNPTASYLLGKPLKEFWDKYVWQSGYQDGIRGLILAVMSAYYRFLAGAKLWERWHADKAER